MLVAGTARADGPFEGTWTAGPTRIEVSLSSWGPDCGPRPQSTTVPSPGNVRVTQDGDHLEFHGRSTQRTDRCWSENRAVRRVSSSHQSGVWRTVCRTPEQDARAETGTYTLRAAGENRLELTDVSRYDWQLNESRCVGTITSTQAFTRVSTGGASTRPDPVVEPQEPACTPGAPARIRLAPQNAEVEPGGEVRFRARVVDAAGCTVRGRNVQWDLVEPEAREARLANGVFTAGANAAEAEGTFTVVARSSGLEARTDVNVRTADLSDLIAKRTSGGVVQVADDEGDASGGSAAGLVARRADEPGSLLWPLLGAGIALVLLAGATFFLLRRKRPAVAAAESMPPPAPARAEPPFPAAGPGAERPRPAVASARAPGGPRTCPVCHKEYDDPTIGYCPADGAPLVDATAASGQAWICPTCRRGFGEGVRVCPTDGDELIPYALFVKQHREQEAGAGERTKICPKCGDRYALTVTFCGKDGSELVLVN